MIAPAFALAGAGGWYAYAQVSGDRGIAPVAATSDIEVQGIEVDVSAENGLAARDEAWVEAQRKAWEKIDGPSLPDSTIDSLVSAIVIQRERMGPKRYVATLGVVFDRERASRYLGASGQITRSAPLLLLPVTFSGGVELLYEQRNEWQRAWAEYQAGASRIDYVRPSGSGGESLLLTYGQTGRRSRTWWRNVLDQFNASDVLVPIARLDYEYPGGPVNGTFSARYGPDSILLETFTMRAENSAQLPAMLDRAVLSFNGIFERALASGRLKPDPTLEIDGGELTPVVARLVELGRQYRAQDAAAARRDVASPSENAESDGTITDAPVNTPPPEGSVALYTVQFATPDAEAFDSLLAAVRGTPGVRNAGTRSTAIGGTSVMTVSYGGSIGELAAALRARGLTVQQGSSALSISR
ncbi:heavy-metal-associated domain-containing protein [Erythrobacter litoralis]|uniref:heavy-metal-associated domain-containing protein n=1 Tax=Erythrobacter litoralis TaxID=39960 RepID=UPI00243609CA|nr:heavy-metal-associated domain-containing protein [Erythrobacter litoralis]